MRVQINARCARIMALTKRIGVAAAITFVVILLCPRSPNILSPPVRLEGGNDNVSELVLPVLRQLQETHYVNNADFPMYPYVLTFSVYKGRLYVVNAGDLRRHDGWAWPGRISFGVAWILAALERYGTTIPDMTFMCSFDDFLLATDTTPVRAFAMSGLRDPHSPFSRDWVLVDGEGLDWVQPFISPAAPFEGPAWHARENVGFWRGSFVGYARNPLTGGSTGVNCGEYGVESNICPRCQLVLLSRQHPELLDARFTHVQEPCQGFDFGERFGDMMAPAVSREAHSRFKYLVNADGRWFSSRAKFLLALGSVVLLQRSHVEEYWHQYFRPYEHYIPYTLNSSSDEFLPKQLQWLQAHDERAYQIARAGQLLARCVFHPDFVTRFIADSLRAYHSARVLPFTLGRFTVELPACRGSVGRAENCVYGEMCLRYLGTTDKSCGEY